MLRRPNRNDTEDDIIHMQEEYFVIKKKQANYYPSTKFKRMKNCNNCVFAQSRANHRNDTKCLAENKSARTYSVATTDILSEMREKVLDDFATSKANISVDYTAVLGEVIERNCDILKETTANNNLRFQKVLPPKESGTSIFALSMNRNIERKSVDCEMVSEDLEPYDKISHSPKKDVESLKILEEVHADNMKILSNMTEAEILQEQRKIRETIDPTLCDFVIKRYNEGVTHAATFVNSSSRMQTTIKEILRNTTEGTNIANPSKNTLLVKEISNPARDIIEQSVAESWINFDVVEQDKLQWMGDIPMNNTKLKLDEPYEARFDWKGVLLPNSYSEKHGGAENDNRHLYLHGDEPHRPGYTLQELFHLARSNVVQQRIAAFGALGGILNLYNQGFYDKVLELPITKIFFLLRLGLDDNNPAMLEVVSRATAYLFYNENDECLLDFVYDNVGCHWQPILQCSGMNVDSKEISELEDLEQNMRSVCFNSSTSTSSAFSADAYDHENKYKESISDLERAETDLIKCLANTHILQRIYFILHSVKPENSTVISCLKLLIRLARFSKDRASEIISRRDLISCLLKYFLPDLAGLGDLMAIRYYNYPQHLCLKMFRILISYNGNFALKLLNMGVVERVQNYLYNREDIKGELIKVQIECLRIVRCLLLLRVDTSLYKKLLPAYRYLLEWHLNHVIYEVGGSALIRQHAAALLAAIVSGPCNLEIGSVLAAIINNCCSNWFYKATKHGITELSQSMLLGSCLNAVTWLARHYDFLKLENFYDKYLCDFIVSRSFVKFIEPLESCSILLHAGDDRSSCHPPLINAGSVILCPHGPQLVVTQTYCIYLLTSLWRLLELHLSHNYHLVLNVFMQSEIIEPIVRYLKKLKTGINFNLVTNFFAKCELKLIYSFICFNGFEVYIDKSTLLEIAYNLICCLTAEHIPEIEQIFQRILFNPTFVNADSNTLRKWRKTFLEFVYSHYIVISPTELTLTMLVSQTPILSRDWPYLQLKMILQNYVENVQYQSTIAFSERDVLDTTLRFVGILEKSYPNLMITTPTEKLMYLMMAFMGPNSEFLTTDIGQMLHKQLQEFCRRYHSHTFNFNIIYKGKCNFDNIYGLFVDHFQAASYGNELFSSLVLIPTAMKYNGKWRRRLWSDYAAALRFLNCSEDMLLGGLNAYLTPAEEDESLVKAYNNALRGKLVRPHTIPYKIAKHHVDEFKKRLAT